MRVSTCKDCDAEIRWTITQRGKRMSINPNPTVKGNVVIHHVDPNGTEHSRVLKRDEVWVGLTYIAHAATCPAKQRERASR